MHISDIAPLLLDAASPRHAAQRTLQWLQDRLNARSIALWRAGSHGLTLEISVGADEGTLEASRSLWESRGNPDGRPLTSENALMVATRPNDTYVYVDGVDPKTADLPMLVDGGAVVAQALSRGTRGVSPVGMSGHSGLKREELITTLRLHEWNIARVARVKGVTRKTIYDWLDRYQIQREHVEK